MEHSTRINIEMAKCIEITAAAIANAAVAVQRFRRKYTNITCATVAADSVSIGRVKGGRRGTDGVSEGEKQRDSQTTINQNCHSRIRLHCINLCYAVFGREFGRLCVVAAVHFSLFFAISLVIFFFVRHFLNFVTCIKVRHNPFSY